MKVLAFLFLFLLIFPTVFAIEFNVNEEFAQGETLITKVSGNFLQPLQKSNVFFYRAHVNIPMEYDIRKIDDDYYIYALLFGKEPNDYSIALEGIQYMQGSDIMEEDVKRNFTINNQTADFTINPGFANTNSFSIEVQNLQDREITIEIKTKDNVNDSGETYQDPITLKSGQTQEIDFLLESQEHVFKIVELSTENLNYNIPVDVPATEEVEEEIFKFEPEGFTVSVPTDSEIKRTVYIYNTGDEAIEDITLSLSNLLENYVTVSETNINRLDANSNIPIELTFLSEEEFEVEGHIKAKQGDQIIYSQISVKFLTNFTPSEVPQPEYTTQTCAERGYPICSSNEECSSEEIIRAKDNICCIGTCQAKEAPSSAGKVIGIFLLIAAIGFAIWFFKKKYKGAKKPVNLLKIAKGKRKIKP